MYMSVCVICKHDHVEWLEVKAGYRLVVAHLHESPTLGYLHFLGTFITKNSTFGTFSSMGQWLAGSWLLPDVWKYMFFSNLFNWPYETQKALWESWFSLKQSVYISSCFVSQWAEPIRVGSTRVDTFSIRFCSKLGFRPWGFYRFFVQNKLFFPKKTIKIILNLSCRR